MLLALRGLSLASLVFVAVSCATGQPRDVARVSCNGRLMWTIINQSQEAVEAVAFREGVERVLALAPPGLASLPFQPPRPEERNYSRPEQRRQAHWFLREVATRRMIPSRDPKVRTNMFCVDTDD